MSVNPMRPEEIKQARKALGLTQQAFAEVTGYSISAVASWEQDRHEIAPGAAAYLRLRLKNLAQAA